MRMKYSFTHRERVIGVWAVIIALLVIGITVTENMNIFTPKVAFWGSIVLTGLEFLGTIGTASVISKLLLRRPMATPTWLLVWGFATVCSVLTNTGLAFLVEYLTSPHPHTPIGDRVERYPLILFVAVVITMAPLVGCVSFCTIHVVRVIQRNRHHDEPHIPGDI